MRLGPVRPRFHMMLPGSVEESMARVVAAATLPEHRCVCRVLGRHIDIALVREDRRRWSPCVQLEFADQPQGEGAQVHGLVGPHPNLWTLFAFLNISVALLGGIGVMLGLVQVSLEMAPWGFWVTIASVAALVGMYLVSQFGQRCAAAQTHFLRDLVEGALRG